MLLLRVNIAQGVRLLPCCLHLPPLRNSSLPLPVRVTPDGHLLTLTQERALHLACLHRRRGPPPHASSPETSVLLRVYPGSSRDSGTDYAVKRISSLGFCMQPSLSQGGECKAGLLPATSVQLLGTLSFPGVPASAAPDCLSALADFSLPVSLLLHKVSVPLSPLHCIEDTVFPLLNSTRAPFSAKDIVLAVIYRHTEALVLLCLW